MRFTQGDYLMTVKERDDAIKKTQEEEERKVCAGIVCLLKIVGKRLFPVFLRIDLYPVCCEQISPSSDTR